VPDGLSRQMGRSGQGRRRARIAPVSRDESGQKLSKRDPENNLFRGRDRGFPISAVCCRHNQLRTTSPHRTSCRSGRSRNRGSAEVTRASSHARRSRRYASQSPTERWHRRRASMWNCAAGHGLWAGCAAHWADRLWIGCVLAMFLHCPRPVFGSGPCQPTNNSPRWPNRIQVTRA
jgi:hypothetical protein